MQTLADMALGTGQQFGTAQTVALGEAVASFIREGGTLDITTAMDTPARFLELLGLGQASPAAAAQRLGLTARVSAPQ